MDIEAVEIPLRPELISDVDALPHGITDEAVIRLIGAAFVRTPLSAEELRDSRLVAFLLDVGSSRFVADRIGDVIRVSPAAIAGDRLAAITGLSVNRAQRAMARLVEAQVLEQLPESSPGWFRFSAAVICPVSVDQHIDWSAVLSKIAGHGSAALVLRVVVDSMEIPWDWSRLTYEVVAARASYSIGMAQRGISQLMRFGILERLAHAGRGHDYRLSAWAMGRALAPVTQETRREMLSEETSSHRIVATKSNLIVPVLDTDSTPTSTMAVEIGGLIVRVPVGTEIRMTIGVNGESSYQVGPELKITRRG